MAEYVIMPKLGFNMNKGKIVKWLKKEGEMVQEREPILQIETDKTVIDVEASTGGFLRKIFLREGSEVPVTLPIGIIAEQDEDIENMIQEAQGKLSSMEKGTQEKEIQPQTEQVNLNEKSESTSQVSKEEVKISPRARKMAKQFKIDLNQLKEFKGVGIVNEKDIKQFQDENKQKVKKDTIQGKIEKKVPYTGIRKIIGDRLSQSKFTAPHLYFTSSINMQKSLKILEKFNQDSEIKITINDLIVFVVAKVLEKNIDLNVSLVDDQIIYHDQVNMGIAVAIEEGLIVPVVRDANEKSIIELSEEIKKLAQLAHQRKLPPEDYEGGTFTVSNLGMYDLDHFTAIINPPEAAILAVGSVKRCPVVDIIDGIEQIVIKSIMKITLSVDHRLIDGVTAVTFLTQIKENIENFKSIT
jgi:pyruvate dehydrogenase E2 component (dihydrolipoamide acetyltransferase)